MAAHHTSRPRPGTSFCLINFLSGSTPPTSAKRKRLPSSPRKKSSRMRRNFFFSFLFHARKADSALTRNPPVGAASLTNFQYHLKLQGYPTQMGIWRHVNAIHHCRENIASYRAAVLSTDPSAFEPPHAEISFCPRGCLIALSLGVSYTVLYCFQRFHFSHMRLSNH